MSYKKIYEYKKDAIEEGIASDLFKSQRYYFIYRSIGEHYHLLEDIASRPELSMLSFLQASSQDLCIIHLAKIMISPSRDRNIR